MAGRKPSQKYPDLAEPIEYKDASMEASNSTGLATGDGSTRRQLSPSSFSMMRCLTLCCSLSSRSLMPTGYI